MINPIFSETGKYQIVPGHIAFHASHPYICTPRASCNHHFDNQGSACTRYMWNLSILFISKREFIYANNIWT